MFADRRHMLQPLPCSQTPSKISMLLSSTVCIFHAHGNPATHHQSPEVSPACQTSRMELSSSSPPSLPCGAALPFTGALPLSPAATTSSTQCPSAYRSSIPPCVALCCTTKPCGASCPRPAMPCLLACNFFYLRSFSLAPCLFQPTVELSLCSTFLQPIGEALPFNHGAAQHQIPLVGGPICRLPCPHARRSPHRNSFPSGPHATCPYAEASLHQAAPLPPTFIAILCFTQSHMLEFLASN
ncbi:unnamed protein product [Victoria cruziana]